MDLTFWVGDYSGDSPTMRFSSGPSGQLKLFQMVDLLVGVREEWRTRKLASWLPVNQGLLDDAGIGEALSRSISQWAQGG